MNTVYMMIGIQGSGKSTYADRLSKEMNIRIISSDAIRKSYPGIKESEVFPKLYKMVKEELLKKNDVIFDATNITRGSRKHFMDVMNSSGMKYNLVGIYLPMDKETCKERVKKRNQIKGELFLPLEAIDSFYKKLEEPLLEEGFKKIVVIK